MTSWFRLLCNGAFGLSACLLLVSCDDGSSGGGPPPVRLFFSQNNFGSCESLVTEIDLQDANAVLAHKGDGSPDCAINAALSDCDVSFTEINDGSTLRVAIADCRIPAIATIFDCSFKKANLVALDEQTHSDCSCNADPVCIFNSTCLELPALCINADPDHDCELCFNDIDDDGNGKVDCADPKCDADCGVGQSTLTCPASSTTTTTTSSSTITDSTEPPTTTTTLPEESILVQFHLDSASGEVGALQWNVDYANAPGQFLGSGATVQCTSLVSGALFAPNDVEAEHSLHLGVISLSTFPAPADLVQCSFAATGAPVPADFPVTIVDATDGDGNPITATISVSIPVP
ncbi:MAG TPA: hypothetical protein VN634_10915 [Candidatus Limnocylindrales bacterium]|nr:hypothetical protein [Candidatus Limnocylindrales bacterium]